MYLCFADALQKFRGFQHVDRPARRVRAHVAHIRFLPHSLFEALDHHRFVPQRRAQLREAEDDAEPQEQRQDKDGARKKRGAEDGPQVHHQRPAFLRHQMPVSGLWMGFFAAGRSNCTSCCRTSSIATRSAFFGCGWLSWGVWSKRGLAPRRSCFARSAAISTNRNRFDTGGAGSAGSMVWVASSSSGVSMSITAKNTRTYARSARDWIGIQALTPNP